MANLESFENNKKFSDKGSCDILNYDQPVHVGLQVEVDFNNTRKDGKYGLKLSLKYNQRTQIEGTHKIIQLLQECHFLLKIDKPIELNTVRYEHALLLLPVIRDAADKLEEQASNNNCSTFEITPFTDTGLISALLKAEPHFQNMI